MNIRRPPSLGEAIATAVREAAVKKATGLKPLPAPRGPHGGGLVGPDNVGNAARTDAAAKAGEGPYVCVTVPVKTISESNDRGHWAQRARRAARQRAAVALALIGVDEATRKALAEGCTVKLTRVSPGRLDYLNLGSALKHIADAVAVWLFGGSPGENDDDPRVTWDLDRDQLKSEPGVYGVIVSIRPR